MSNIRNPNDVRSRGGKIIMPGEAPGIDDIAAQRAKASMAMEQHPFYQMLKELEERVASATQYNRMMGARFNALIDYMHDVGILLTQPMDPTTGLVDDTAEVTTPKEAALFWELLENVDMPKHGIERYIEEHLQHDAMSDQLVQGLTQGAPMEKALEAVRAFNDNDRRLRKMNGSQFPLGEYLSLNPDSLPQEELDEIAAEFGLKRREVPPVPEEDTPIEEPTTEAEAPKLSVVE